MTDCPTPACRQLTQVIGERYSCRAYDSTRPVSRDIIGTVIDAARMAPSACNRQPWKFLVVDSAAGREAVARAYPREWILSAPAFIIAIGDHSAAWHRAADGKDHTDVDVSIAVEHICLAAASMGLGTCWVCNFDTAVIRSSFNIREPLEPIAILPVGYPAPGACVPQKIRKDLSEILRYDTL